MLDAPSRQGLMRVASLRASSVDGEPRLGRAESGVCSLLKRSALRESLNYPLSAQLRPSSLERMMVVKVCKATRPLQCAPTGIEEQAARQIRLPTLQLRECGKHCSRH